MATIVNNPPATREDSGSGIGIVVGLLLVLLLAFFFIMYLLPMIRQSMTPAQVNVPSKVDVNVNGPKK
jgi:hypothetical protein